MSTPTKKYLLAEQTISPEELDKLADWLRTNPWLTQGPLVRQFEAAWGGWLGRRHSLYNNSGSSANLLMYAVLQASDRLRNDTVIAPAVSWPTTVTPGIQLGFRPHLCEADPNTFGLDLNHLEDLLKKHQPGAVIMVHVLGCPNDMDGVMTLKERYGFVLMEDCCASHGSTFAGRKVGTFGELSSFSFYYGHHMSTIEGGMVCTDDEELHDLLLMHRSHGWTKDVAPEKERRLVEKYGIMEFHRTFTFYQAGYNFRSTDLNAKIGLGQMDRLDAMVGARVRNHRAYQEGLAGAPGLYVQRNEKATISSISFGMLCNSREHREMIAAAFRTNGIETRPIGGGNMSRQPFFFDRYGAIELPMADRLHRTSMQLPNHHLLTTDDVATICSVARSVPPV